MKSDVTIKKSLTKTLTFKLALLLIVILIILTISSYSIVSDIVHDQTLSYNKTIADNFLDSLCAFAAEDNQPVDENYTETINSLSTYLCERNYAAFVYTYVVSEDLEHVKLLGVAERPGVGLLKQLPKNIVGQEIEFPPTEEELELWELKRTHINYDDHFIDNAAVTACVQKDSFGNRIVVGTGVSFKAIDKDIANDFLSIILVIFGAFLILTACMYFIIRRSVLIPAKKISDFMATYITNGQRTHEKLDDRGNNEFAMISSAFNKMNDNIDLYLKEIKQLNSTQERQNTELDIASKIQQGFLPANQFYFKNCEIFGRMMPAKNIGGDLFDYSILKDGRILLTIADVSGKGVPASMYMAVILVVMRQLASAGKGPAEILRETNNILAQHNKYSLFATALVGIYDPETKQFSYANAGHLPPYILRGKPEFLPIEKNLVLGLFSDEPYMENSIQLSYGDAVFLYTDGVTEAINDNKAFFGEERLKSTLDRFLISRESNIVNYVDSALSDFINGTDPHDDITMLSFTVKKKSELQLSPDKKDFSRIKQLILESALPKSLQLSLCVAAEEIFINICSYAFENIDPAENRKKIQFVFEHSDRIFMRFVDNGIAYDPTKNVQFDMDYNPDEQLGGLGKMIAFTIADDVSYEYRDNCNILTIIKYLREVEL